MISLRIRSLIQTQKLAEILAREIKNWSGKKPLVLALEGQLGSGKTTFVKGVAHFFGIRERVVSPTFVLLKIYKIPMPKVFKHLVHIDCCRLDSPQDLLHLGFKNLLKNKDAIVLIEWAGRIKTILPKKILWIKFKYGRSPRERVIQFLEK